MGLPLGKGTTDPGAGEMGDMPGRCIKDCMEGDVVRAACGPFN